MITVTTDGACVVSHVGSGLLAGMADRSGLTESFSDALAGLRERRSGHDPGRVVTDLAVVLADGDRSISDLAVLREQPVLFGSVASTATAWRVLNKIDPAVLDRLRAARALAREQLWEQLWEQRSCSTAGGAWSGRLRPVAATTPTPTCVPSRAPFESRVSRKSGD
jgi:DDE family transposase